MSLNTRSMRNKVPSIMAYVKHNSVDLTLIQETWIRKCDGAILTEIKEHGYDLFTYRKPIQLEWGGGVAIIFKRGMKVNCIKCLIRFKTFEHVTCKVMTVSGPFLVISIYRRGYSETNKFTVNDFILEFSQLLDDICDASTPIVIAGDINIHVERMPLTIPSQLSDVPYNVRDVVNFYDLLKEYNLKQLITVPTHEEGGTLDLAMISGVNPTCSVGFKDQVCLSDHFHICMDIPFQPLMKSNKVTLQRRPLENLQSVDFREKILGVNLIKIDCDDVNEATNHYNLSLSNLFNEACPVSEITVNSHKKQPWYNDELRQLKQITRQTERRYRKNRSSLNHNELLNARNLYKICLRQTRSQYISKQFDEIEDDISLVYKTANHYLDDADSRCLPSCKDNLTLANDFADFFLDKIIKIRHSIENDPQVDTSLRCSLHTEFEGSGFSSFCLLSDNDVLDLVNKMACKLNSADPIPLSYLKDNIQIFLPALNQIVNLSLQSGIFPDSLKHGRVTPIAKARDVDTEKHKNFRPVTTLMFLSKLLEKAASTQLISYLENESLIPLYQSAYLKSHSCETALFKFSNDVQQMLSDGKVIILVQLDLSAAFDTVDHSLLLHLLKHKFGVAGTALQWMTSYLTGRSFSVKIGYVEGKQVLLIYGVPQGSILGPLLFILYISDLPTIAAKYNISFQSYADDSHLYVGFDPLSNYTETMSTVKKCIHEIEVWMKSNFLQMNVGKTEVLFIAKPHMHSIFDNMSITIGEKCYTSSSSCSVESLGVKLNSTMSIQKLISEVVKSSNFNLKKLSHFKYVLSVKHKLLLIKSHILNKLDYCSVLLVNAPATQICRLQSVINKAIRFVHLLKKYDRVSSFLKDAHILPMKQRIMYKSCVFVFNMLHGKCPHYMKDLIQHRIPNEMNTRSNNDNLIFSQTSDSRTIQFGMIKNWNSLPYNIRCISSEDAFKKHLKTYYFNISYAQ